MLTPLPAIPRVATVGAVLAAAFLTGCVVHPIGHHHRVPGVVVVDPGGPGYGHGHRHRDHHHRERHDRHHDHRGHHGR